MYQFNSHCLPYLIEFLHPCLLKFNSPISFTIVFAYTIACSLEVRHIQINTRSRIIQFLQNHFQDVKKIFKQVRRLT